VSREVVAASQQRSFVDRSGHDSFDFTRGREFNSALDRKSAQLASDAALRLAAPVSDRRFHRDTSSLGPDDYNVTALDDHWVGERFRHDLWANPARISHGHGKTDLCHYILIDT
jgi:hypothetical protein